MRGLSAAFLLIFSLMSTAVFSQSAIKGSETQVVEQGLQIIGTSPTNLIRGRAGWISIFPQGTVEVNLAGDSSNYILVTSGVGVASEYHRADEDIIVRSVSGNVNVTYTVTRFR